MRGEDIQVEELAGCGCLGALGKDRDRTAWEIEATDKEKAR